MNWVKDEPKAIRQSADCIFLQTATFQAGPPPQQYGVPQVGPPPERWCREADSRTREFGGRTLSIVVDSRDRKSCLDLWFPTKAARLAWEQTLVQVGKIQQPVDKLRIPNHHFVHWVEKLWILQDENLHLSNMARFQQGVWDWMLEVAIGDYELHRSLKAMLPEGGDTWFSYLFRWLVVHFQRLWVAAGTPSRYSRGQDPSRLLLQGYTSALTDSRVVLKGL